MLPTPLTHLAHTPALLPAGDGNWRTPRGSRTGAWEALKKYIVRRYTVVFVDEVRARVRADIIV